MGSPAKAGGPEEKIRNATARNERQSRPGDRPSLGHSIANSLRFMCLCLQACHPAQFIHDVEQQGCDPFTPEKFNLRELFGMVVGITPCEWKQRQMAPV